ncbi:MAG: hypothetical protein OEZ58_24230, partial [Gammaproteobacteria bacterium]|nr:hypothetical protein [Gammaproteobacteria bacterium]
TIDFEDRTTNIVGQRPPTGLGVIPRTTVSRIMFGAPSIQPSSIDGLGQALLFAPSGTSYDQVFLETADLAAATQYCFESDILVHNILGSNNGFTVLFDTPQVRRIDFNQNGSIDKFVPFVAGSSTSGVFGFNEVFTLQVSIDLSSDTWTIYQNGNNISSGGFGGATELRSIRLSSGSLSGVIDVRTEVDNIVLRSGELCHTQLPPPPPVIVQVPVNNISKVSASPSQSIALTLDGEVQVWGNTASFVGLETNYTRPTTLDLTQLASPIEVTSVLAGTGSYHLISTKGSIHSWGANVLGALANAGALTASSSLVTAVASDQTEVQNVEAIFENSSSFIAKVADDEDFVVWGNNASNQLGVLAQSVIFSPIELFED